MTIVNAQTMQDAFREIEKLSAALAACKRKSEQRREVLRLIWTNHENYIPDDIWYRISKALEDE